MSRWKTEARSGGYNVYLRCLELCKAAFWDIVVREDVGMSTIGGVGRSGHETWVNLNEMVSCTRCFPQLRGLVLEMY